MPLAHGTRLGPYEIAAPLGAGGMGEVYRARDTRLGRDVAVKVLPQHLGASPEVAARFEREAKTISSLNHPHICTLFDVGREGDVDYLVMELVEGETLAARIEAGPLPAADVLRYGVQIADALDRAHRAGVVHRDLKPANVMITRAGAKLMDFGLARREQDAGESGVRQGARRGGSGVSIAALSQSPTVAQPLTVEGSIIGTFQYMAPEQLEGKEADARSDIWGLGCVLYEMATGHKAFSGKSQASLISSIMGSTPAPVSQLAPLSPPGLDRVVSGCLAKDPDERLQTAHDVKLQLQWIAEGGSQAGVPAVVTARRRGRERMAWLAVGVLGAVALALGALQLRPKPAAKPVIFELTPPPQVGYIDLPRISPDGRKLAFNAGDSSGTTAIWVRPMNSLAAQRLPGTEGATRPFWSPDARFLAYFSGGKLWKIDTQGGPPVQVCEAPRGADGCWSENGTILFDGTSTDTVQSVPAGGGVAVGATRPDRAAGETFTAWPEFLPDGKHFLFVAYGPAEKRTLKLGTLGTFRTKSLGPAASRAEYASGHVLYVRNGVLLAQRFDARAGAFRGDPFPVAQNVEYDALGSARFSASHEGTLVYRTGGSTGSKGLTWVDRSGRVVGSVGQPADYSEPALSPDETQLVVDVSDPGRGFDDLWVWDLSRNLGSRFTFEDHETHSAVWMPDGRGLVFAVDGPAGWDIWVKRFGGNGRDSLLFASADQKMPTAWSPDGRTLLYQSRPSNGTRRWDVMALTPGQPPRPFAASEFAEYQGAFSPDGRLVAYASQESGKEELYVQSADAGGGKWRISTDGGREPHWRGDGRELFYVTRGRQLYAVSVAPGPKFSLPVRLCDLPTMTPDLLNRNRYVATRDGQRFLVVTQEGVAKLGATTVALDWLAGHDQP